MSNIILQICLLRLKNGGPCTFKDHDLAALYGYEVRALNQQVKRNIGRIPDDFMFQLTKDEVEAVKSQIVTSPNSNFFST